MKNRRVSAFKARPHLECLLDRADVVFKEMNELLLTPNPDLEKLKELDEECRRLVEQMAENVQARTPSA